jgi:hypothetical protein
MTKEETRTELFAMLHSYGFEEDDPRSFRSKKFPGVLIRLNDNYTSTFRYAPDAVWMVDLDANQLKIMLAGVIHLYIKKCRNDFD